MNYTEEQIKEMVLKIMSDLNNDYFYKDEIEITFEKDTKLIWGTEKIKNCWVIGVGTPDFQFNTPEGDSILIFINDEDGEVLNYVEGPGRPVALTLKLNNDNKYEFVGLDRYTGKPI